MHTATIKRHRRQDGDAAAAGGVPVRIRPRVYGIEASGDRAGVTHAALAAAWQVLRTKRPYDLVLASSAADFFDRHDARCPGCLVVDADLPGVNQESLVEELHLAGFSLPWIVLTGTADVDQTVELMRCGAYRVLVAPCEPSRLAVAIDEAIAADSVAWVERQAVERIKLRARRLTPDEWFMLHEIVRGTQNTELADRLGVGLRTIEKRRRELFDKLSADSLSDLLRMVYRAGLVDGPHEPPAPDR